MFIPKTSMGRFKKIISVFFVGFMLLACRAGIQSEENPMIAVQPSSTAAASLVPTQTSAATATPIPTITPTVTPAHPLSVAYLKQQRYSGELITEEHLAQTDSYDSYIVSYLSEGFKNYALLTVPSGEMPETGWPVIIFNHGYIPPEEYRTTQGYQTYVHAFAAHGYIVLRPDYRGHGDSEGEPQNTYFYQGNTIDVLNAVVAVKNWETADPDRIGMWGHSMGGWISLRAMVVDPDIRVGVIWAGVLGSYDDLCVYWFNCANWDDATWAFWKDTPFGEYGLPEENESFWMAASTDEYLIELKSSVQLHHATTDAAVPVELAQVTYEKLLAAEVMVEYYEYPGDDHNISQNFDLAMTRSLDFFDLYLKGVEN